MSLGGANAPTPSSSNVVPIGAPQPSQGWGAPAATNYDIEAFYVRATDAAGHSEASRVRFKPEIYNEIMAVVSAGIWPHYRSPHDLIRDAVVHRLHWLSDQTADPDIRERLGSFVERIAFQEWAAQEQSAFDAWDRSLTQISGLYDTATEQEDWEAMLGLLLRTYERADHLREPYRGKLREIADLGRRRLPDEWEEQLRSRL